MYVSLSLNATLITLIFEDYGFSVKQKSSSPCKYYGGTNTPSHDQY